MTSQVCQLQRSAASFFLQESLIKGVRQTFFFCACLFSKSFKGDLNPGSENLEVPRTKRISVIPIGSVTLTRVVLFCFSTKSSPHRYYTIYSVGQCTIILSW